MKRAGSRVTVNATLPSPRGSKCTLPRVIRWLSRVVAVMLFTPSNSHAKALARGTASRPMSMSELSRVNNLLRGMRIPRFVSRRQQAGCGALRSAFQSRRALFMEHSRYLLPEPIGKVLQAGKQQLERLLLDRMQRACRKQSQVLDVAYEDVYAA
ncbi:hypothetical protein D3C84_798580 [compost metagenome]